MSQPPGSDLLASFGCLFLPNFSVETAPCWPGAGISVLTRKLVALPPGTWRVLVISYDSWLPRESDILISNEE